MIIPDLLAGIANDLHQVNEMLTWATTQAWWPATHTPDAPRSHTPRPLDENPDHVPGPRYATGVGDHASAEAIRTATRHLAKVEYELHEAIVVAIVAGAVDRNPQPVRYGNRTDRLPKMLPALRHRLVALAAATPVEGPSKRHLHRHLTTARTEIDRAWRTLDHALTRGEADPATHALAAKDLCIICRIRPRGLKKGKRCETCARYLARAGHERPRTLDSVDDATDAQRRRRARGEGFGDESLAGTSLPPLHDCTCTPDQRCDQHPEGRVTEAPGCSTPAGYQAHHRAGERACEACTRAWWDSRDRLAAMIRTQRLEAS